MKTNVSYFLIILSICSTLGSCGSENSVMGLLNGNKNPLEIFPAQIDRTSSSLNKIDYYEELNEAMLSLHIYTQQQMNDQITALKADIELYIASKRAGRSDKTKYYYLQYQRDYKEVQKLKAYQNDENVQMLEVALVRIKNNMEALEQLPTK